MKRFVRYVSFVLVFSLLLAVPAYATGNRASSFFSYTNAYLSKGSGTTFHVSYHVIATGVMEKLGVSSIKVQESSNNSNWSTIATYSNLTKDNAYAHDGYITCTGTANKYYRAVVEFYAKDGTGIGTKIYTTSSITVP